MEEGLRRIGGNERLYRDLLIKLKRDYADCVQNVEKLFLEGRTEEALRLAHTVKGVAGNLGAKPLQAAALIVEKALQDGVLPPEALKGFGEAMTLVQDALSAVQEKPSSITKA